MSRPLVDRLLLFLLVAACMAPCATPAADWPQYETNPFVIEIDIPAPEDSAGSMITADVDGDGLMDYLVTVRGYVACHGHDGAQRWLHEVDVMVGGSSEREGLPGHHGPGVAAGDVDGDGKTEVVYLLREGALRVVDGATGAERLRVALKAPAGAERWEHLAIANFRGTGDHDLLLQATNASDYRMGRYLAAFAYESLAAGKLEPLWATDKFFACAHNGARLADLDGDGRDEVLGGMIISPEGKKLCEIPAKGHLDSIFAGDVQPNRPGLEVVALEEGGGNQVFLCNAKKPIWESTYEGIEPQNAALGDFDPVRPGLEVWCRSRFDTDQKPFVIDARGELAAAYELATGAPDDWTKAGLEVICTIDWTGEPRQLAVAKERHEAGDICVFDPMNGAFIRRIQEQADRLYVADVSGDWREEILVLRGGSLRIYQNTDPNPNPGHARLWQSPVYRRMKMTWNYYSP